MKKRILSLILAMVLLLSLAPMGVLAAENEGGFIKKFTPWEKIPDGYTAIYDEYGLMAIEQDMDGEYILMNDIVLSSDWDRIGSEDEAFSGVLEGNGYTISGLNEYKELGDGDVYYNGIFARINNAEIRNLRVEGSIEIYVEEVLHKSKNGGARIGAIAGYSEYSIITNCISNVKIQDNQKLLSAIGKYSSCGGIVGYMNGGTVSYCLNLGKINAYRNIGGIVGETTNGSNIYACLNKADIRGTLSDVAGIVGVLKGQASSCANEGGIVADSYTGGIAGDTSSDAVISDCLNMGRVWTEPSGGFTMGGGIARGKATIQRCINVGETRFGAIRYDNTYDKPTIDCFYLEGCGQALDFTDQQETTEGRLTAEEMKDPDTFGNYSIPGVWTLEEDMDYPYPTALLDKEMENPFKTAYVQELLRDVEEGEKRMSIFEGSGAGSAAAVLSKFYQDAGLDIVNNGWKGINFINDCVSFDFDVDNDFDVLLADLLMSYSGMDGFGDILATEIFGEYSDMITHLCNSVEGITTLEEVQKNLEEAGKAGGNLTTNSQKLMDATNNAIKSKVSMGDVNKAFTFLGCVTDTVGTGLESAQDLIDFFTLVNAYAGAGDTFGDMLEDISLASYSVESTTGRAAFLRSAIGNMKADMQSMIDGDYLAFYNKMGEEIVDLAQTGANCIVNICSGFSDIMPVAAGLRMGLGMGVFFGDQVTNMDSIAYYGNLMDLSGYLAQCIFEVAMDYRTAFMSDPTYENALRLNAITELYLKTQSLSCQYAFDYSMALAEKSVFKYQEHIDAAMAINQYRIDIDTLLYEGTSIMLDKDGGISGFIAKCPVTVIIEDEKGTEIARLESGKETRADGYADYYCVFGDDMDKKTGLYGEGQSIRIIAEDEGSMDLILFESKNGEVLTAIEFEDVILEKGDEFVPDGFSLVKNGEEYIYSSCSGEHSWDDGKVEVEAGCLNEGSELYTCLVCGETETIVIQPIGHDWDEGKVIKEATEDEEGEKLISCRNCEETRSEVIPKVEIAFEGFKDVPEGIYFYTPVEWAVKKGVTTGVGNGLFAPNQGCTRGQVVTFLWRAAGKPAPKSDYNPFSDVSESEFYYEAVLWAVEEGITGGVSATRFAPKDTCTRGQIVTFLYRAFGKPEVQMSVNPFADVAEDAYFLDSVLWAVENGITTGMSATSFAPSATCTRAQVVTFLYRAYENK